MNIRRWWKHQASEVKWAVVIVATLVSFITAEQCSGHYENHQCQVTGKIYEPEYYTTESDYDSKGNLIGTHSVYHSPTYSIQGRTEDNEGVTIVTGPENFARVVEGETVDIRIHEGGLFHTRNAGLR